MLRSHDFTHTVLFKNSFASALAVFLAGIPSRIGYAREGRSLLLTDKLYPPKRTLGRFKPVTMLDYYLAIASWLGADTTDRNLELLIDPQDEKKLHTKFPQLTEPKNPVVVLVPGGAFGPSKCWQGERFAQTADWLIENYNAAVVVSVSSVPEEKQIAKVICTASRHKLINLADNPITLGELKALFAVADLVITNDTGPRHIAIALRRKLITLFGPNDPCWTDTGYENEIRLIGSAPCAPCAKPVCEKDSHLCMQAIATEMVCSAAKKLLENRQEQTVSETKQRFVELSKSFFIDADFRQPFSKLGLTSIDAVFSFDAGENLTKDNLAKFRSRIKFEINSPPTTLFLKRYEKPPVLTQLKNWLQNKKRISCGLLDVQSASKLTAAGINTPKTIAYGRQWGVLFEKRSFSVTEKIPNAESLERRLPDYFPSPATIEYIKLRRAFIARLADFVRGFHRTGCRHRDLYLSHIFYSDNGRFHLIDLARCFKPSLFAGRFRIKDLTQLFYSAPARYISSTDRLRFYLRLTGQNKLTDDDKAIIHKILNKAAQMAKHDKKHGRFAPFAQ